MKLFRDIKKWFDNQEHLFYLFLVILIVPNVVLCFTEPISWTAKICNILLPLSIYYAVMAWSRNCGRTFWLLFPFIFFGAFQLVLLYLFGQSIIAVDMFLNLVTTNSSEALELLEKNFINLIVSDIMMPKMDGIELCRRVKNDLRYSHIPLILLTAKTNLRSKISGMDAGADAYVEKPFSSDYLLSVIANLIKSRQKLSEAFSKNPLVLANTMATSSADTDFIVRLQEIIHANLSDPEFKINDIAEMVHMSRASFYRKIKGCLLYTSPSPRA